MLIVGAIMSNTKLFASLVKKNKKDLLMDDYGKYLLACYFPRQSEKIKGNHWSIKSRVYERICLERKGKFKRYPFIGKTYNHPFKNILFIGDNKADSLYTALGGYIHEFMFKRWSVAFNKLQMIVHENAKYLFSIKDISSGKKIIKEFKEQRLIMSTYEERDFLQFWDRRNFNPISHASKNGLTAPEVTRDELVYWEKKIIELVNKMFKFKQP